MRGDCEFRPAYAGGAFAPPMPPKAHSDDLGRDREHHRPWTKKSPRNRGIGGGDRNDPAYHLPPLFCTFSARRLWATRIFRRQCLEYIYIYFLASNTILNGVSAALRTRL